jgi:putative ABC transport system ATP-binding protein
MAAPVARLQAVRKRFGAQPILDDVSLDVAPGELVSLIGRSGSGKSTLLSILGGLDLRYEGRCEVLGQDLQALSDRALARLRNRSVGFVFQSFNLLDHLSVAENVRLPAYFADAKDGAAGGLDRAEVVLDRVGMKGALRARPGELSGGQKQRVAIARALYAQPRLLLADEPTGNLDAETGREVIELFQSLRADGLTLLIVTHEERVSRAAERVLRLIDGRLSAAEAGA